ncbi:hypothetical protein GCM10009839_14270 [Catenulispora yoronensis]|uniref:Lipoprotein n=1 Tax=Catenulispora yoronensis TaxID=450799 RepID=A0ABN2TT90_9ACTN
MRLLRTVHALLLTAATTVGGCPVPAAASSDANPYSCRSAHVGAYRTGGVLSDACDGLLPDGSFGGEALTGFGPDEQIDPSSGRVRSCTVQLNRVERGRAVPVPGANATEAGRHPEYFDGRGFCDAMDAWRPAPGFYNVTVFYRLADGTVVQTVQGPVAYYPGGTGE